MLFKNTDSKSEKFKYERKVLKLIWAGPKHIIFWKCINLHKHKMTNDDDQNKHDVPTDL